MTLPGDHAPPLQDLFPMKTFLSRVALSCATVLLAPVHALADDGHDHGNAPSAATGPAQPRFAAVSETFELVGVLNGKHITLYLDRSDDNSPVPDAQIELEIAGAKFKAEKHGDAEYEVTLADTPQPGVLPITAMVTAGNEADLLAGELDIHEDAEAHAPAPLPSWTAPAAWVAAGIIALALLTFAARRVRASRSARTGGAA
jgi:hypothetical protein